MSNSHNSKNQAPQSLMKRATEALLNQDWQTAETLYRSMAQVLASSEQQSELAVVLYYLAKSLEGQGKYFATFEVLTALDDLLVHLEKQNDADAA